MGMGIEPQYFFQNIQMCLWHRVSETVKLVQFTLYVSVTVTIFV